MPSLKLIGLIMVIFVSTACGGSMSRPGTTPTRMPAPTRPPALSWNGSIGQLLNDRCASCHGQIAGLSYATYESAMRGSMNGPVILPGDPSNSKLMVKQLAGNHPGQLASEQLAWVKAWIKWGAPEK
jgi:hypothetical protein